MNRIHYALAMKRLHRLAKELDDEQQCLQFITEVTKHPGFEVRIDYSLDVTT